MLDIRIAAVLAILIVIAYFIWTRKMKKSTVKACGMPKEPPPPATPPVAEPEPVTS